MSAKHVCLATLVTALLGLGAVRGQPTTAPGPYTPPAGSTMLGSSATPPSALGGLATRPGDTTPTQEQQLPTPGQPVNLCLSDWIVGPHGPGCCGPVGANGPVQMEIYLQSGLTFPFSDGVFGHTLREPGWDIQGGGRTLFFNAEETAAWVVDVSISNVRNHGRDPSYEAPLLHIFQPTATTPTSPTAAADVIVNYYPRAVLDRLAREKKLPANGKPITLVPAGATAPAIIAAEGVSIADLNRTFVNLGFGRDWYLYGQAPTYLNAAERGCGGGPVWRIGVDGGGRYGSAKLELHETRHRTDTIAGMFVGAHSDVEVPCGCCIFQAGVRVEYDYTWMDILGPGNDTDLEGINLLFSIGARF